MPVTGWGNSDLQTPCRLLHLLAVVLRDTVGFSPLLELLHPPPPRGFARSWAVLMVMWQLNCIQTNIQASLGEYC